MPALKRFLSEVKQGIVPQTLWSYDEVGHTQDAKKELLEFVKFENTDNVLDTVKPTQMIQRILQIATDPHDSAIILDFFAGSGSTGQAVFKQNDEDGGNRRAILVQLPEPLPMPEQSLHTIADITKERVLRVIQKLNLGILITDHNVRETLSIVDRAYLIDEGRVVSEGTKDFLINDPISRQLYLGERFQM
jgi:adenine-specific DNA-methyltransferase